MFYKQCFLTSLIFFAGCSVIQQERINELDAESVKLLKSHILCISNESRRIYLTSGSLDELSNIVVSKCDYILNSWQSVEYEKSKITYKTNTGISLARSSILRLRNEFVARGKSHALEEMLFLREEVLKKSRGMNEKTI